MGAGLPRVGAQPGSRHRAAAARPLLARERRHLGVADEGLMGLDVDDRRAVLKARDHDPLRVIDEVLDVLGKPGVSSPITSTSSLRS